MGFFFLLLILGSPVFGGLLYGFYVGARAFAASWGQHGPHMITLRFLALNLCEPLVNSVIVTMLLLRAGLGLPAALFCTAPMAVLLLPALGLGFADPFYRDQCRQILRRGMLRWGTNLVILLGCSGVPVLYVLAILAFLYSLFLLWQTILAGKAQLDVALSAPLPTLAPLPSPAHGPVARVPTPVLAPPRAPAPPLDPERAVRCALCQAPTAPDATDCPCCGLVFLSRVPAALQALGSYTVLRPLGGGGMSSVYLARSRADNALCVLKTLASVDQQLAAWRQEAGRCLRREAILLGQLDHPRVARLLDWSGDGQNDFLVLEYVAGPTLEQRLTRASAQGIVIPGGPLPLAEALAYGRSVDR